MVVFFVLIASGDFNTLNILYNFKSSSHMWLNILVYYDMMNSCSLFCFLLIDHASTLMLKYFLKLVFDRVKLMWGSLSFHYFSVVNPFLMCI